MMTKEKEEKKESTVSNLEIVRLKIPRLIPLELIEAVKGRTFSPEQFIAYQEQQIDNPGNFLYALIDAEKKDPRVFVGRTQHSRQYPFR